MTKRKVQEVEDGIETLLRIVVVMARHDDDRIRGLATIIEAAARGLQHETIADALTKPAGVAELCRRILAEQERAHGLLAEHGGEGVALIHAPARDNRKAAARAMREQVRMVREEGAPHGEMTNAITDLVLACLAGSAYARLRPPSMPAPTGKGYDPMRARVSLAVDDALMNADTKRLDESIVRAALRAAGLSDVIVRNLFRV